MALDATVAGASANSYLTVADADLLAAADVGPEVTAWGTATTDQKERALKRATREIDGYLRSGWAPFDAITQRLSRRIFPRSIDYAGSPAVAFIPDSIRLATYEQATYVHKNQAVLDNAAARRARGYQSASEPNVSYSERAGDEAVNVMSPAALHYLEGFRRAGGNRGIRSVRMASGYVW